MKDKVYQHFKGNLYNYLGVVHDETFEEILKLMDNDLTPYVKLDNKFIVLDATGDELVPREVVIFLGGYYFLENEGIGGGFLYHPIGDDSKFYFRTFDNFFELLEKNGIVQRFSRKDSLTSNVNSR